MPTSRICDVEPFRYQSTPQIDGQTGASSNQINEQHLEDYLNRLREAVCADVESIIEDCCNGGGGGAESFLELSDTPASYAGQATKLVRVNAGANALEFVTPSSGPDSDGLRLNYTTSEQATNRTFLGSTIYQKTVNVGGLPASGNVAANHGITNLLYVLGHDCWAYAPSTAARLPIPFASPTLANNIQLNVNATQVIITVGINRSTFTTCYCTLFYTKT